MKCTIRTSVEPEFDQAIERIFMAYQEENGTNEYDFVLVAVSDRYPVETITSTIERVSGNDRYLAFHSTDAFQDRTIVNNGVTALFFTFERRGSVSCFVGRDISTDKETVLAKTAEYLDQNRDAVHLLIGGLCHNEMAFFVDELNRYDIPTGNLLGGLSSGVPSGEETYTYQFHQGEIIRDGFVIVSFHNVTMASSIAMGFEPIGIQYTISKAEGYRVYSVDEDYPFTLVIKKLMKGIEDFEPKYLWYTPVVILEDGKNQEIKTLRTFRKMTSDWVEFYGPVKEGQLIKLSYGDTEHLITADRESVRKLKHKLPDPEILINFSCIARQYVLEEKQEAENIAYLEEVDAPLFGFFTFGEIGHDPQRKTLQYYNETSLLIGMREQ